MIIMLMRHAEDKDNKITRLGKKQIKLALCSEEKVEFSKIYTSASSRCVETARPFAEKYNIEMEICEELKERELLDGRLPKNEKEQEWYDNYLNPEYSSINPEGCKEYLCRNFNAFKKIIDRHFDKNENVIIVAHSGTLYALVAYTMGIEKMKNINWFRMGNCNKIYFEILKKNG